NQLIEGMAMLHGIDAVGRVPEQLAEMGNVLPRIDRQQPGRRVAEHSLDSQRSTRPQRHQFIDTGPIVGLGQRERLHKRRTNRRTTAWRCCSAAATSAATADRSNSRIACSNEVAAMSPSPVHSGAIRSRGIDYSITTPSAFAGPKPTSMESRAAPSLALSPSG